FTDPSQQSTIKKPSYGIESRLTARALAVGAFDDERARRQAALDAVRGLLDRGLLARVGERLARVALVRVLAGRRAHVPARVHHGRAGLHLPGLVAACGCAAASASCDLG